MEQTLTYGIFFPGALHVGIGAFERLPELCPDEGDLLAVVDKAVSANPLVARELARLGGQGRSPTIVDSVPPEPSDHDIARITADLKGKSFAAVVAIGGGSVLDAAKLFAVLIPGGMSITELADGAATARRLPLILVPTTAGTGSEATPNAIVAIPRRHCKVGIVRREFLPDHVILDPRLTATLPGGVTAATGIDALCHAIECYTASVANPVGDLVAAEGARLILSNLRQAFAHPDDLAAREAMLLGAFYGGVAISAAGTNIVHALSYPLGGRFHIPHGVAKAVLLVAGLTFNADACQGKLARLARHTGVVGREVADGEAVARFLDHLSHLVAEVKIPSRLADIGVPAEALAELVEAAFGVKRLLANNPKPVSPEDIRGIYERVL